MVKDAEPNKELDNKKKEESEIRYKAESYNNQFEKVLNEEKISAKVDDKQKQEAKKVVDDLKKLLEEQKWDELKQKLTQMDQLMAAFP